jgi:hypothetical protein
VVYIADLTIAIIPGKRRINLDAIKLFVEDLRDIGGMAIGAVSFDQFQSSSAKQYLKRKEFEVHNISVDRTTGPYLEMISLINQGRLKMGRNIHMKNNLKSLRMTERKSGSKKVDHLIGNVPKEGGDKWETSWIGYYAKDVSDSVCGAIELHKVTGHPVTEVWEPDLFKDEKLDPETLLQNYMDKQLEGMELSAG